MQNHFGLTCRPARVRMASANGETVPGRRVFPQPAKLELSHKFVRSRGTNEYFRVRLVAGRSSLLNFAQSAAAHVVHESTHGDLFGNPWMGMQFL